MGAHYAQLNSRARIRLQFGAWLSLVERTVRDREVGGSNPLAPTILVDRKLDRDL